MARLVNLEDARLRTTGQNTLNTRINQNERVHSNPMFDTELRGLDPNMGR